MIYTSITEAMNSIPYGLCSMCEAKHNFPDVKCDLMFGDTND